MALELPGGPLRPGLGRITDRRTFGRLRRRGTRVTVGGVSVVWVAPTGDAAETRPRVAFAVGRQAGGAVLRNRVRRRLRACLAQLAAAGELPPGAYLVRAGAEAATTPFPQLCATVGAAVQAATAGRR